MSFRHYTRRLRPFRSVASRVRNRPRASLCLEPLEERTVLSVTFQPGPLAPGTVSTPVSSSSADFTGDTVEPQVQVNPANPTQLIAGTQYSWMVSSNSGASFTTPRETPFYSDGDIATAYDSHGRLFYVNILDGTLNPITPGPPDESGIAIMQIDPTTGKALNNGYYVNNITTSNTLSDDKPFLAVGPNDTLYVTWDQYDSNLLGSGQGGWRVLVSFSTDQGQTWSTPTTVTPTGSTSIQAQGFVWPSTVAVGNDGTVYVAYHAQPGLPTDGGPTLANPNPTTDQGQVWLVTYHLQNNALQEVSRTEAFTPGNADFSTNVQSSSMANPNGVRQVPGAVFWTLGTGQTWVLPDPTRPGHVYAVTTSSGDLSGGSYGNVVLATSTDYGQTWSAPTTLVNNNATPSDFSFFPTAAIDSNGDIVVAWYQNYNGTTLNPKNANGDYLLDVYATYSTDGGATFATPFRITPTSSDPDVATDPSNTNTFNSNLIRFSNTDSGYYTNDGPYTTRIGEYFGIDLVGNTAYIAWNGNSGSSAASQALYYTTFGINGSLLITGDNTTAGQSNNIVIAREAANPNFVEVQVNGTVEYAGLLSTLTGITVQGAGPGVNDTVTIDYSNGDLIPTGGITFAGDTGTNTLILEGATSFVNEVETPTGAGSGTIVFDSSPAITYSNVTTVEDTTTISGTATFQGTSAEEGITLGDGGTVNGVPTGEIASGSGTFATVYFANKPNVVVDGLGGADTFNVTPSAAIAFTINGNDPAPPASPGDVLFINLAGTTTPTLAATATPSGYQGQWSFGNRQPISFTTIETLQPSDTFTSTGSGQPIEGIQFSSLNNVTVATFNASYVAPGNLQATIRWGDGTTSQGSVQHSELTYSVQGTHTYNHAGNYTITVTLSGSGGSGTSTTTASIAAAPVPPVTPALPTNDFVWETMGDLFGQPLTPSNLQFLSLELFADELAITATLMQEGTNFYVAGQLATALAESEFTYLASALAGTTGDIGQATDELGLFLGTQAYQLAQSTPGPLTDPIIYCVSLGLLANL